MFQDRTFNLSMVISSCIHLFIILIFSIFIRFSKIDIPPRLIEVEMTTVKVPLVTRMPKERVVVKPTQASKILIQPSKRELPKEIAANRPQRIGRELDITAVLGGRDPAKETREGLSGGKGRYGLPMEETGEHPLFERVERGELWGKGRVTTSERLTKGEAPGTVGLEAGREMPRIIEGGVGKGVGPVDLSGGVDKIPYYHLEGPAAVGRGIVYQELMPVPKWVEEEGRSLRGKLRFWVLPSGEVDRVLVEETFGYPQIDDLAIRTIRRWRFTKGQDEAWGLVSIRIQLN